MKTNSRLLFTFCLLTGISFTVNAFNYYINFTGSGASTTVGSVQVQNLTKGAQVTVPGGSQLRLYDVESSVDALSMISDFACVYPNPMTDNATFSFVTKHVGNTQISVFGLDGRKVTCMDVDLLQGKQSFQLTLPKGVYLVHAKGNGFSHLTKTISLSVSENQPKISYTGNPTDSKPQKVSNLAVEDVKMQYTPGDQILYTATSGTYIASLPDVPSESKTINFVFYTIPTSAIPAGTFTMGSPTSEVNSDIDETQYPVNLSAFHMSKYEITNAQYATFLNEKNIGSDGKYTAGAYPTQALIYGSSGNYDWGLHYSDSQWIPVAGYENAPVINVTWYGATEFASYKGGSLPTEAQWEYSCRAGTTSPFNTGGCLTNLHANYDWDLPYSTCTNSGLAKPGKIQPVGTYAANTYGLYDMHGNVWEWCADRYDTYPTTAQDNPTGASSGLYRVFRGGSWIDNARYCRSSYRNYHYRYYNYYTLGFRVVFIP